MQTTLLHCTHSGWWIVPQPIFDSISHHLKTSTTNSTNSLKPKLKTVLYFSVIIITFILDPVGCGTVYHWDRPVLNEQRTHPPLLKIGALIAPGFTLCKQPALPSCVLMAGAVPECHREYVGGCHTAAVMTDSGDMLAHVTDSTLTQLSIIAVKKMHTHKTAWRLNVGLSSFLSVRHKTSKITVLALAITKGKGTTNDLSI